MRRIHPRVLVVEDDAEYRLALLDFFQRRLGAQVVAAATIYEADMLLEPDRFDLLSLDILMEQSGLSLLRRAAEKRACRAAVVFSGSIHDAELRVIPKDQRPVVRQKLQPHVQACFPQSMVVYKDPGRTVRENIEELAAVLTRAALHELCQLRNLFEINGPILEIRFEGERASLPAGDDGFFYIEYLLARPNAYVAVTELYAAHKGERAGDRSTREAGLAVEQRRRDRAIDSTARNQYRKRLSELLEERWKASDRDDRAWLDRIEEETEFIKNELHGAKRPEEDPVVKKSRDNVCKAIRRASRKIADALPALGRHLEESFSYGAHCRYQPPESTLPWE